MRPPTLQVLQSLLYSPALPGGDDEEEGGGGGGESTSLQVCMALALYFTLP